MEFTFNKNKPTPYSFLRIDRLMYKFKGNHNNEYKLDFKPCTLQLPNITFEKYESFALELINRFDHTNIKDERVLPTCLNILYDFLPKQVTTKIILLKQDDLLTDDIFGLKNKFDLKKLEPLFEPDTNIYLVKEV